VLPRSGEPLNVKIAAGSYHQMRVLGFAVHLDQPFAARPRCGACSPARAWANATVDTPRQPADYEVWPASRSVLTAAPVRL